MKQSKAQSQAGSDLIVSLAWESWGGPRRGEGFLTSDRFVQSVLADDRLRKILIVNAMRSLPAVAARRLSGQRPPADPAPHATVITPLRWSIKPPIDPLSVERSIRKYSSQVIRRAAKSGLESPSMVTSNPLVAGFGTFPWPVTYFAFDDWAAHPRFSHLETALLAAYDRIASSGRPVVAVSQTLLDRLEPTGPGIVVPNGVDSHEWRKPGPTPDWLKSVKAPRATYVGGLDERMDLELLTATIEERPNISFVLVGSGHDQASYVELAKRSNVTVHGAVDRNELTALVMSSDVGLVPHRRNELTESMSPLKVYEYLAAGLPVAAVDLEPMRGIDDRVVIADAEAGAAGYLAALDRALSLESTSEQDRLDFLDSNDWKSRHRLIIDIALGNGVGSDL